jgi:hypothetical protein
MIDTSAIPPCPNGKNGIQPQEERAPFPEVFRIRETPSHKQKSRKWKEL